MRLEDFMQDLIGILSQYMFKGSDVKVSLNVAVLKQKEGHIIVLPDQRMDESLERHKLEFTIKI